MSKRVVVITGGSSGMGYGLARELSECTVVILARNVAELKKSAKELGVDYEVCDVTNATQIQKAVKSIIKKYGRIDVLVNNAGMYIDGPIEKDDPKRISQVIDVNTKGPILMTNAVVPVMLKKKKGLIVNMVSRGGITSPANQSVYNASKWAMTGFTQTMHEELSPKGIRVSGVYPGTVKTKLFSSAGSKHDTSHGLEVADVVRSLAFIIRESENVEIQHLVIKHNG